MKTGKQRLGRRLLALMLAVAALLTVLPGAFAADGEYDDIALATQWSFPAGWHYSADDHSFTHDPEGESGVNVWGGFNEGIDASKAFKISFDAALNLEKLNSKNRSAFNLRLFADNKNYFFLRVIYTPSSNKWSFTGQYNNGAWVDCTAVKNTTTLGENNGNATVTFERPAGEKSLRFRVVSGETVIIDEDFYADEKIAAAADAFFEKSFQLQFRSGSDGPFNDVFTVSAFSVVNDGEELVKFTDGKAGIADDNDYTQQYDAEIGAVQWEFTGRDENWHFCEDGSVVHLAGGGETAFVPKLDPAESFRLSFDLHFDMTQCRSDFPAFILKLSDGKTPDSFLFVRIKLSSYNSEWLPEPQFYSDGTWTNLPIGWKWGRGVLGDTAHVLLEHIGGEDDLRLTITSGDAVICTGSLYNKAMTQFLSDALQLRLDVDERDNNVFTISNFSLINGDTQLFNPGEGGTALPERSTFNGDTDERGVNFSAGEFQLAASERYLTAPNTVEAWVKVLPNVGGGRVGCVFSDYMLSSWQSHERYFSLEIAEGGKPQLYLQNEDTSRTFTADVDVRTGEWTHIAFTRDTTAGIVTCYINGEESGRWTLDEALRTERQMTGFFSVGGDWRDGNPRYFIGSIADVRVYADVRTAAEVAAGRTGEVEHEALLSAWPLDEADNAAAFADASAMDNVLERYESAWFDYETQPGDYSFVVFPDTQNMILQSPKPDNNAFFRAMVEWVAENKEKENMQFLMHLGDVVNNTKLDYEFDISKEILAGLDGVLPYSISLGNHDYDKGTDKESVTFNEQFPLSRFAQMETFGGAQNDTMNNTYHLLEAEGNKYLILALEFGPSDAVLAWANEVVAAHPEYQVIVTTHGYLMSNGDYLDGYLSASSYFSDSNNGSDIWEKLVSKHENIFMVLCGHVETDDVVCMPRQGDHGNTVYQILADAQGRDAREGMGMILMLRFRNGGKTLGLNYFSPYRNASYRTVNQFTLQLAPLTYTVAFVDGLTKETIATVEVEEGKAATAPAAPEHEGYTFKGWDKAFDNVTENLTVAAIYEKNTEPEKPWENPFKDVKEADWFYEGVKFANQHELFNGTAPDEFSPDDAMTRAMLVTVLWRLDGKTEATKASAFVDVPAKEYYADAVAWAAENGIVNGVDATHFAPNDEVTREQIAAILFRYAEKKGIDTSKRANLNAFPDANKVSAYAKDALAWANAEGLVKGSYENGKDYLNPTGSATRAQVATILARYAQSIEE